MAKVKRWPGLHFGKTLMEDRQILAGTWINRTEAHRIKNRGEKVKKEDVTSRHEIRLAQLPCGRHLSYAAHCKEVRKLIREVEEEAALERELEGVEVVGAQTVLENDPDTLSEKTKKSYAPRVHAASREARKEFLEAFGWFFGEYRDAAEELHKGNRDARFPEGCFPPGLPYVGETGLEKSSDTSPG